MGEPAAASGSALVEKRGAIGKPLRTCARIWSRDVIQAIASAAISSRSGGRLLGTANRKPPTGEAWPPPGPAGWGRYFTLRFTTEWMSYSIRAARMVQQ